MRNRKLNRGLLPLVVLVWGLIGYRFWYEKEPTNEERSSSSIPTGMSEVEGLAQDTFSLSLPFRDPFLGARQDRDKRSPKELKNKSPREAISSPQLPHISYQGRVKAKEALGLLLWEGKSHTVLINESLHNAKVQHIDPQYIELLIEGRSYKISKGKSIGSG